MYCPACGQMIEFGAAYCPACGVPVGLDEDILRESALAPGRPSALGDTTVADRTPAMDGDEGPVKTVGWGPFALPGERRRLVASEKRRLKEPGGEVPRDSQIDSSTSTRPRHDLVGELALAFSHAMEDATVGIAEEAVGGQNEAARAKVAIGEMARLHSRIMDTILREYQRWGAIDVSEEAVGLDRSRELRDKYGGQTVQDEVRVLAARDARRGSELVDPEVLTDPSTRRDA